MNFDVFPTIYFEKSIKKLVKKFPSLKQEYAPLITELSNNPTNGEALGKHCYKIRMSISSKGSGKSGGGRIITLVINVQKKVILLDIYDKSDKSIVTDTELELLIKRAD